MVIRRALITLTTITTNTKNNCQKIQPVRSMISTREFIYRSSYFLRSLVQKRTIIRDKRSTHDGLNLYVVPRIMEVYTNLYL